MPPRKGSLGRSPLGQASINSRRRFEQDSVSEESLNLLSASHDLEHYPPVANPRYTVSLDGPLPSRGPSNENQQHDSQALTNYDHHVENNHEGFHLTDVGDGSWSPPPLYSMPTKQSLRMQRWEGMDYDPVDGYLSQKSWWYRQCCCLHTMILCILFIVAVVIASLCLAIKPTPPTLEMEGLNITSFSIEEGVNGAAPQVAAGLRFALKVANPSKQVGLVYDQVRIEFKYQESLLGAISNSGFKQLKENKTLVVELAETLTVIQEPLDAVKFLEEASGFNVQTDLRGAVVGHYKILGIRLKKFDMPVDCKLNVKPDSGDYPAHLISRSCYHYPA